ncbi:hypothetical protein TNCV_3314171 [Trichonephila clavipes]|nr:hypothetical protein TNCV_3314171 [Trichonephila clavipes]
MSNSCVNDEVQHSMIWITPTLTSTKVGFKLGTHQSTALDYIKRFGFVSEISVWVPHELCEKKFNGWNFDVFLKSCPLQNEIVFGALGDLEMKSSQACDTYTKTTLHIQRGLSCVLGETTRVFYSTL